MWTCDFKDCDRPAVRSEGGCIICDRHLCVKHIDHECPTWQDGESYDPAAQEAERKEITRLLKSLDLSALLSRARSTRSSVMGGMNYHIEILFDDGFRWLARIRRFNATSPPPELRDYIMRSEVATLQFLSQTKVTAPKVFDYGPHGQTLVGVGYILMEKLPGKSLRWSLASPEGKLRRTFDDGQFYLRHADDKGDHILIDDDYNITGIIDWEWAYAAPISEAFKSPIMLLPVADSYNGVNCIGEDELTFASILEEKGNKGLAAIKDAELDWVDWKQKALERYSGDEQLETLLARTD
ncbi:hypothetical protein AFLA_010860 [Aspergillus flavus NRRL3357]|nr:hypothetical protein AFLA_010860 [Aspergillus flavus NRRL3357]